MLDIFGYTPAVWYYVAPQSLMLLLAVLQGTFMVMFFHSSCILRESQLKVPLGLSCFNAHPSPSLHWAETETPTAIVMLCYLYRFSPIRLQEDGD
jgi:hypothetical protein